MGTEGPPKVEDLDPATEQRLIAILQGITGGSPVSELAARLGLSRERYYELQRKVLRASREALKPEKPGRKAALADPEKRALERRIRRLEKELSRQQTLLSIAKRQGKGPEKDPDPSSPGGALARKGDKGNRYPTSEKAEVLTNLDQEKALGTTQADFARATGYSLRSLGRWRHRADQGALADRPSRPLRVPSKIPESRREEIRHLHLVKRGTYGPEALRLAMGGPESASTIGRILQEPRWEPMEALWTKVGACHALDFMHLGPLGRWGRLLTVQEEYSRFKPMWELRRTWSSRAVARHLEHVWDLLGVPLILKHDQGSEFTSGYFQGFLAGCGVLSLPSPPYRGSYNGKEERSNGFIRAWTRPVEESQRRDLLAPRLLAAYEDLNYERRYTVLGGRTPDEVFSSGPRVCAEDRRALLRAAKSWASLQSVEDRCKERGRWIQRRAAVVAAQETGLLVIRPRKKCQPVSA